MPPVTVIPFSSALVYIEVEAGGIVAVFTRHDISCVISFGIYGFTIPYHRQRACSIKLMRSWSLSITAPALTVSKLNAIARVSSIAVNFWFHT